MQSQSQNGYCVRDSSGILSVLNAREIQADSTTLPLYFGKDMPSDNIELYL
jgi:hypothetical protein